MMSKSISCILLLTGVRLKSMSLLLSPVINLPGKVSQEVYYYKIVDSHICSCSRSKAVDD